jgi:tyrosine-specific transport protein
MLKLLKAISILLGTVVGAGIFGIPYIVGKSGIVPGLFYFLVLASVSLLLHLFFGEAFLRTKESCRLPGLAQKYLGGWGNVFAMISVAVGLIGALLAYLILSGDFLKILFGPALGGSVFYLTLGFWLLISYFIFRGIKVVASIELLSNIIFFLMTVAILFICLPAVDFHNIKIFDASQIFLPFGVILFSLIGWSAIPEIIEFLKTRQEIAKIKKAILGATVLVVPFYIIFTLAVLGVSGQGVSQDSLSGLSPFLGRKIIIFGALAGLVTLADSILVIGVHLKNTLIYDLKISNIFASLLVCGLPFLMFLLGFRNFIGTLGIVGTLVGVIEGLLIILIFRKAKTMGNRQPEYSLKTPSFLLYFLMAILILGAISQFLAR